MLFDNTFLSTDLSKMVNDDRETGKPKAIGQPGGIDDFVDGAKIYALTALSICGDLHP